jgi:hypothetical protein
MILSFQIFFKIPVNYWSGLYKKKRDRNHVVFFIVLLLSNNKSMSSRALRRLQKNQLGEASDIVESEEEEDDVVESKPVKQINPFDLVQSVYCTFCVKHIFILNQTFSS